jgi:hypothetical protein
MRTSDSTADRSVYRVIRGHPLAEPSVLLITLSVRHFVSLQPPLISRPDHQIESEFEFASRIRYQHHIGPRSNIQAQKVYSIFPLAFQVELRRKWKSGREKLIEA